MKYEVNARADSLEFVAGSFGLSTTGVAATYTFPVASGTDIVMSVTSTGTGGNAKRFTAVADASAFASVAIATANPTGANDSVVTATAAGTTPNGGTLRVVGADLGAGATTCYVLSDTTTELIVLINLNAGAGQSTVADFETAVNTSTNWDAATGTGATALTVADCFTTTSIAGGTAQEYIGWSSPTLTLHYTDLATTVDDAVAVIAAASATTGITSTTTDTNLLAAGDAVAAQAFTGGVAAVALDTTLNRGDDGVWSVARKQSTGVDVTGTYTLTFLHPVTEFVDILSTLQLTAADDKFVQIGAISVANKTIDFEIWDISGAGLVNPAVAGGNRINFVLFVRR